MDFSDILKYLKVGHKVGRKGWNGKEMFVCLINSPIPEIVAGNEVHPLEPFFLIKTMNNKFNTWVPSISDILANDWEVIK